MESKILKCLECHNCKAILRKNIFNCRTGHRFCENCKSLLRECVICKNFITVSRNMALELIIQDLINIVKDFKPSANSTVRDQNNAKKEELCIGLSIKIIRNGGKTDNFEGTVQAKNISEIGTEENCGVQQLSSTKNSEISINQNKENSSENSFAQFSLLTLATENVSDKILQKKYLSNDCNKENSIATNRLNENIPLSKGKGRVLGKITACFNNNARNDSPTYIKTENFEDNNKCGENIKVRPPFKVLLDNKQINFLQCPVIACKTQYADFMALKGHLNYIHTNCFTIISYLQQIDINLGSPLASNSIRKIVKFLSIFFVIDCYRFSSTWYINVGMIFDSKQSEKCFKFRINHEKRCFKIEPYPHQEPLKGVSFASNGVQKVTVHFLAK